MSRTDTWAAVMLRLTRPHVGSGSSWGLCCGRHLPGVSRQGTMGDSQEPEPAPTGFFLTTSNNHDFRCFGPRPQSSLFLFTFSVALSPTYHTHKTDSRMPTALRPLTCRPLQSACGCRRGRTCASPAAPDGLGSPHRTAAETQAARSHAGGGCQARGARTGEDGGVGFGSHCHSRPEPSSSWDAGYLFRMEMENEPLLNIKCSRSGKHWENFAKKQSHKTKPADPGGENRVGLLPRIQR